MVIQELAVDRSANVVCVLAVNRVVFNMQIPATLTNSTRLLLVTVMQALMVSIAC